MKPLFLIGALSAMSVLSPLGGWAQQSQEELSKAAANPIANMISLPLQNNIDYGFGPYDRSRNVLNIQPVIPLAGGKLLTRTIIPIVWMPDIAAKSGNLFSGLSDILITAFYVPESGKLIWGVGPAFQIPSGGSARGTNKWSIGPSVVALTQSGDWTLGILSNNIWSFAGSDDSPGVNQGLLQYFIVRQLGGGWYVNSAPIITVNWNADQGQQWIVPFGLGGGALVFVGKLPLNLQVGAYYNAVKPDVGPKWQFRLQAQILLPTSIFEGN